MRADYYDWCIPLFGKKRAARGLYNETCTFLMTKAGTYFISPDFPIAADRCCMFEAGLAMPTPDWLSNTQYNGTATIRDKLCDLWWFPGTSKSPTLHDARYSNRALFITHSHDRQSRSTLLRLLRHSGHADTCSILRSVVDWRDTARLHIVQCRRV